MRNLIILGYGRSGTSAVAGMFRQSGAYYGDQPLRPTASNIKGYFEDSAVNAANNELIEQMGRLRWLGPLRRLFLPASELDLRCYWQVTPAKIPQVAIPASAREVMLRHFARQPFCLKDPRFSTTLSHWRPFLPAGTRQICLFREPVRTVESTLRDGRTVYEPPLPTTEVEIYRYWLRVYRRLLCEWSNHDDWLFISYDSVLNRKVVPALEAFAETKVDASELDPALSQSRSQQQPRTPLEADCWKVYEQLRARAEDDLRRWTPAAPTA